METDKIDINLYSRQIGTFGMETMGKLIQMKVLIIGMRGLGVEVAKNIVLAGPHSVAIYDETMTSINDLGSNFFLSDEHVGKARRDEASLKKLAELNPYVNVEMMKGSDILEAAKGFNVIVVTEMMDRAYMITLDEMCRKQKKGLIYASALGISGFVFVDFGKDFVICDNNGEECKTYLAKIITNDKLGAVTIDDEIGGKVDLSNGDYVTFKEVKGMTELNDGKPRQIEILSGISFAIGDTSSYKEYITGGIIQQVKIPKARSYKSLAECFDDPTTDKGSLDPLDFSKFGRTELLHCVFTGLHEYFSEFKGLPNLNDEQQATIVLAKAEEVYSKAKCSKQKWIESAEEFNDKVALNVARWAKAQIAPVTAFLGGVVAQEIVKFTGKYTPINQWLLFDFFETVENLVNPNRAPKLCRYDDQIAIYGQEIQEKLEKANVFMIGAGALGCEFLKNFALMGISTQDGKLVVTDNDSIETSNLNRQFLFRKHNVGQSKSKCACEAIRKMNPSFKCSDLQARVGFENEDIFDDEFWNSQTFVINAVDNVNARKYIDFQCTLFGRPLIDSGTLGTKAHVQMIVPHVTTCYNDTHDPPEKEVGMCTMHLFPAMIEHCIEWGRDHFNEYFSLIINDSKKMLQDSKTFYENLKKENNTTAQRTKLISIKDIILLTVANDFNKVIEYAVKRFTENFYYNINQLLYNFPPDFKNKDGSMFWSGSKRVPTSVRYDANDELSLQFVYNYSVILARALSIQANLDKEYIKQVSASVNIPEFVPKSIKIKVNDSDPDVDAFSIEDDSAEITALLKELSLYEKTADPVKLQPEDFEKDDDKNGHIDFIHACSNLRARNYLIDNSDRQKTKWIAGKIIPAIATTTASITGCVALQLYSLLQTKDIHVLRNFFMNLAVCLFVITEPEEKIKMKDKDNDPLLLGPVKAIPPEWSVWDKIEIEGSRTVQEMIDYFKEQYAVEVSAIHCNGIPIAQTFMPSIKNVLSLKIEDLYNSVSKTPLRDKKRYCFLEISGDIGNSTALMPIIKYVFKK